MLSWLAIAARLQGSTIMPTYWQNDHPCCHARLRATTLLKIILAKCYAEYAEPFATNWLPIHRVLLLAAKSIAPRIGFPLRNQCESIPKFPHHLSLQALMPKSER